MQIVSNLYDKRIESENYLIEMSIKEYLEISKNILLHNEYQRKRVKGSNTIYSLLKKDLLRGCIIPPIVLAISCKEGKCENIKEKLDEVVKGGNLLILDGLQRTYTLIDLEDELLNKKDKESLEFVYNRKIRVEIYTGINKVGILYRMLTLNTGQTPVSLRHQIEILYLDYLPSGIEGIKLIREFDEETPHKMGEYRFEDVVDGFNSYIEKNEIPMDRLDILDNIKGLEKLSQERTDKELFKEFLICYNSFLIKMNSIAGTWQFDKDKLKITNIPFGKNIINIFAKSQPISGFGAAVGKLIDFELITEFEDITKKIEQIKMPQDIEITIGKLLLTLDKIKNESTKIGNSQRMFFQYFFRELFNEESDAYLDIDLAIEQGYRKYFSQK